MPRVPVCLASALFFALAPAGCGDDGGQETDSATTGETDPTMGGESTGPSTGRIPGCLEDLGIDLFAAEADSALGLTWNNNAAADYAGGYAVRYGTASEVYEFDVVADCPSVDCEFNLIGLDNGVEYFIVVDALSGAGTPTETSCEVSAVPHQLAFQPDQQLNEDDGGEQDYPDVIAQKDGWPLFAVWEDGGGGIALARSDDLGDDWSSEVTVDSGERPALAFRDAIWEGDALVWEDALYLTYSSGGDVLVVRGGFPEGLDGPLELGEPTLVAAGLEPDIAVREGDLHVAFEEGDAIFAASGDAETLSFGAPVRVDSGGEEAHKPSIAANFTHGDVYVGYEARRGSGDFDIYVNISTDHGASFPGQEVRVDDDPGGQNQYNVSVTFDDRTQQAHATWEDRRGGADVYFSQSFDNGASWEPNLQTGAGLMGDQFTPQAVIDPGRNVYVLFLDTSDGQKPLFSRFNPDGIFDPPLIVSDEAGKAGATARNPAVANDRYGTIYAVWAENRGGPDVNIFFARAE